MRLYGTAFQESQESQESVARNWNTLLRLTFRKVALRSSHRIGKSQCRSYGLEGRETLRNSKSRKLTSQLKTSIQKFNRTDVTYSESHSLSHMACTNYHHGLP